MIHIEVGTEVNMDPDIHCMVAMVIIKVTRVVVQQYIQIGLIDINHFPLLYVIVQIKLYINVLEGHYQLILIIMQLFTLVRVPGIPDYKRNGPEVRLAIYKQYKYYKMFMCI